MSSKWSFMRGAETFLRSGGREELDSLPAQFFWTAPMLVLMRIFEHVDTDTLVEWLSSDELYEYRFLGGPFPADRTDPLTLYRNAIYKQNAGMKREPDVMRMLLEREYGLTSDPEKSQCMMQFRARSQTAFADWMRKIGADVVPLRDLLLQLLFDDVRTIVPSPSILHGGIVFSVDQVERKVVAVPLVEYLRKVTGEGWQPVIADHRLPELRVGSSVSIAVVERGILTTLDIFDGYQNYDVLRIADVENYRSLYRQKRLREPFHNPDLPLWYGDYECTVQESDDRRRIAISYAGAFEASYEYTQAESDDVEVIKVYRADYAWEEAPLSIVVMWATTGHYFYTLISLTADKQFRHVSYDVTEFVGPNLLRMVSSSNLRMESTVVKSTFVMRTAGREFVRRCAFTMVLLDLKTGVGRKRVWIKRVGLDETGFVPPRCARRADGLQKLDRPPNRDTRVQAIAIV